MFEEIRKLGGEDSPGPVSIILAGVHGDERCGVDALFSVIAEIGNTNIRGCVYYGVGNPPAIESGKRYIETDLNRVFRDWSLLSFSEQESYEYDRSKFLKMYLDRAEVLLDLHASFTESSRPFIICETDAEKIVTSLPIDTVVSGFDMVEPGGTDCYMNSIGKVGICVECGYLGNAHSEQVASQAIMAFLRVRGHISGEVVPKNQAYFRMYSLYTTRTDRFVLDKPFADFEEIRSGEIIGIDGDKIIRAGKDSVILFARSRNKTGEEAYLLGEKRNSLA